MSVGAARRRHRPSFLEETRGVIAHLLFIF
jgi:hypothetical protein